MFLLCSYFDILARNQVEIAIIQEKDVLNMIF